MRFDVIHILKAYNLATDEVVATDSIGSELIKKASVAITTAGVTGTTKSFSATLQGSLDGVVWVNIGSAITGGDLAAQNVGATFTDILWKYLRVNFVGHTNITGGTLDIKVGYLA
jgi:hypothetical protein